MFVGWFCFVDIFTSHKFQLTLVLLSFNVSRSKKIKRRNIERKIDRQRRREQIQKENKGKRIAIVKREVYTYLLKRPIDVETNKTSLTTTMRKKKNGDNKTIK